MFKWDGTDVTDIISQSNIYEAKYDKYKYWVIRLNSSTETCIVRNSKHTLPCLTDELKSVFGLQKIGTNWCKYKGKIKILLRCVKTPEGYIKEELNLSKLENVSTSDNNLTGINSNLLKLQVQEIFTFRELLGITCSYASSIIVREGKNSVYPISFYEPGMLTTDTKVIPFTVLEKWFGDTSIDTVVKKLCKIQTIDRIPIVLHNLRIKIEEIIERTDRRNIGYKDCIIIRVTERLQTTLSDKYLTELNQDNK